MVTTQTRGADTTSFLNAVNSNHNSQEVSDNTYRGQTSHTKRGRKSKAEKDIRASNTQRINQFLNNPMHPWEKQFPSNEMETLKVDSLNDSVPNFLDDSLNNSTECNEPPYVSTPRPSGLNSLGRFREYADKRKIARH